MNLITFLLATMVLFSVKTSVAQNTTFKLSDYKNPNYFYQTLDLNFRLNSASEAHKNDNTSDFYNLKSYSLGTDARASYSIYQNSLKSQSELYSSLSGSFNYGGQHNTFELENSELKQHSISNSESLSIGGLKRFYNEKHSYFEVNGSILVYNGGSSNNQDRFDA